MPRRIIRTEDAPAPVAGAPYSQAVAVAAGELLFVSGQVPLTPGGELVPGGVAGQTRQCLANIDAILRAAGGDMGDIIKTTVFMTDLTQFPAMNEAYGSRFGSAPPARATIGVAALPAGASVEIEAIALLGAGTATP